MKSRDWMNDPQVRGFFAIEEQLQKQREQRESVKGKDTPFRVEFRFKGGTIHWQYFETYNDCLNADSKRCRYSIFGSPYVESPTSRQIQIRGPRGGWKKYAKAA